MEPHPKVRRLTTRSMTLVEVMIAMLLASLVFAMLYGILNRPMGLWRDALTQWHLVAQTRMVREKMLRGIDGRYGLREAYSDSIDTQPGASEEVEWIYFDVESDPPNVGDDKHEPRCLILVNPGQNIGSRTTPGSGTIKPMTRPEIVCTEMNFTHDYGKITATYTFTTESGGKNYTQSGTFATRLTNF